MTDLELIEALRALAGSPKRLPQDMDAMVVAAAADRLEQQAAQLEQLEADLLTDQGELVARLQRKNARQALMLAALDPSLRTPGLAPVDSEEHS